MNFAFLSFIFLLIISCSQVSKTLDEASEKLSFFDSEQKSKTSDSKDENREKSSSEKSVEKIEEKKEPKPYVDRKFTKVTNTKAVSNYCKKINDKFLHWGWGLSRCDSFKWHHVRDSYLGDPLIWATFGDEKKSKEKPMNVTMILCGVHGDEITPIKFCFDILHHLYKLEPNTNEKKNFDDNLIVVAPIANPDSFFRSRPTRTNYRGVDINRNFPTKDWNEKALKLWKSWYRSDKRRFPGNKPLSEQETYFQVNLIKRYKPDRIISVHAPLTILDYDGPSVTHSDHRHHEVALSAKHLLVQMSKKAQDYRIKNYPFFPGSLGNYAGNERNIPTYTLELPTSDNRNHKKYWNMFKSSIDYAMFSSNKDNKIVSFEEKIPSSSTEDKKVEQSN